MVAAMTDAARIQHQFVSANGLRFHVASLGEGDKLALCLHGFPECWYSWRHQMPLLANLGYRVWAPDLRGYGESDRPPNVEDYDVDHLMADVAGLVDASGAKSTLLIAHDWGGVIAWYFAMRQVRPLDRLVVMNLPHPACMERELRHWRQIRRSWYALFFQLPWLPEALLRARRCQAIADAFRKSAIDKSRFPDEVVDVYRENASRPGALTAMLNYYRALFRFGRKQREYGHPVIETPTLLLWGEEDIALCKETTYGTDRFVPNLTLHYLPNVSHWVQQEAPEKVNELLEAWLTEENLPEVA